MVTDMYADINVRHFYINQTVVLFLPHQMSYLSD